MAAITTYDVVQSQREDITDIINNIAPTETPVLTAAGTSTANATLHEWPHDDLEAPTDSKVIESFEPSAAGDFIGTDMDRFTNYCQINTKAVKVSGSTEAVTKIGMDSQLAYQSAKRARELKTDVDLRICGVNAAKAAGAVAVARAAASLETWITNAERGAAGANPVGDGSNAATDGTVEALTAADLDSVIEQCWLDGARPTLLVTGAKNKAAISKMDGLGNAASASTHRTDRGEGTIYATADVYVSNFGTLYVMPSRHIRKTGGVDRNIFLIDPEYLKVSYLRPWQQFDLAKVGDNIKRQMIVEWTLEVGAPEAHGIVADRNGTLA